MGKLKKGDKGSAVKKLTEMMKKAGAGVKVGDTFDQAVEDQVRQMQARMGQKQDGLATDHFTKGLDILIKKVPTDTNVPDTRSDLKYLNSMVSTHSTSIAGFRKERDELFEKKLQKVKLEMSNVYEKEDKMVEAARVAYGKIMDTYNLQIREMDKRVKALEKLKDIVHRADYVAQIEKARGTYTTMRNAFYDAEDTVDNTINKAKTNLAKAFK